MSLCRPEGTIKGREAATPDTECHLAAAIIATELLTHSAGLRGQGTPASVTDSDQSACW